MLAFLCYFTVIVVVIVIIVVYGLLIVRHWVSFWGPMFVCSGNKLYNMWKYLDRPRCWLDFGRNPLKCKQVMRKNWKKKQIIVLFIGMYISIYKTVNSCHRIVFYVTLCTYIVEWKSASNSAVPNTYRHVVRPASYIFFHF